LPFPPYDDEREQDDVHGVGYGLGDFEAHVARFSEHAASSVTVGFGDRFFGLLIYELRRGIEVL